MDAAISSDFFGAVYTGFRHFSGFEEQAEELSVSHVRWPGGTLSETDTSVYSLSSTDIFDGRYLYNYNENRVRPGLSEIFSYCSEAESGVTIIIPTARYANDIELGESELQDFLNRVAYGEFGDLPKEIIFEIGNEYYNPEVFGEQPWKYGEIASRFSETISGHLADESTQYHGTETEISVQMGKFSADDVAIRGQFSQAALRSIDMISFHHLPIGLRNLHAVEQNGDPEDVGTTRFERTSAFFDDWKSLVASAGGDEEGLELYLSAWSVGGASSSNPDPSLEYHDYGLKAAPTAIDLVWNYTSLGVDHSAAWGVDNGNLNWFSYRESGENKYSPLGEIYRMMAESLPGKLPLELGVFFDYDSEFQIHGYEGSDQLVFYISALDLAQDHGSFTLDLGNLSYLGPATVRMLNAEKGPNEPFPDIHSLPVVTEFAAIESRGTFTFDFTQDYQIVELTVEMSAGVNWISAKNLSEVAADAILQLLASAANEFHFTNANSANFSDGLNSNHVQPELSDDDSGGGTAVDYLEDQGSGESVFSNFESTIGDELI